LYFFDNAVGFIITDGWPSVCKGALTEHLLCPLAEEWPHFYRTPAILFPTGALRPKRDFDSLGRRHINNEDFGCLHRILGRLREPNCIWGLRWEHKLSGSGVFLLPQTAYGPNFSRPKFPSDGTLHSPNKMFSAGRLRSWDIRRELADPPCVRAGVILQRQQNMLTQSGPSRRTECNSSRFAAGLFCRSMLPEPVFGPKSGPINSPPRKAHHAPPFGRRWQVFDRTMRTPNVYWTRWLRAADRGRAGPATLTSHPPREFHLTRFY